MAISTAEMAAFKKAIRLEGASRVRRLAHGRYLVPSATHGTLMHLVTGTSPLAAEMMCSCEAGTHHRPCWHKASVQIRKTRETALAQMRKQQTETVA